MAATRDRLASAYYESARLPREVAAFSSAPDTLGPGSPAKVGILDLEYARAAERTELVERYQKTPLQIMRPLYIDPAMPGMAFTYLMTTGGGVAQADRYRQDIRCGNGAEAHFTTQAATKIYRMEHDYATQLIRLHAADGAYVEYLPDPLIPFRGARYHQHTELTVAQGATLIHSETITAGRLARDERHAYTILTTDLDIRRPDGTLLAADTLRLRPSAPGGIDGPGVFAGHDHVASLFVVTGLCPATEVADALHTALAAQPLPYGASTLPADCGAWARILGDSDPRVAEVVRTAWDAMRRLLVGRPAPDLRKP